MNKNLIIILSLNKIIILSLRNFNNWKHHNIYVNYNVLYKINIKMKIWKYTTINAPAGSSKKTRWKLHGKKYIDNDETDVITYVNNKICWKNFNLDKNILCNWWPFSGYYRAGKEIFLNKIKEYALIF